MHINDKMPQPNSKSKNAINSDNLHLLLLTPAAPFQNTWRHRQRSRLLLSARACSCSPAACSRHIQQLQDNYYVMSSISQNAF